MKNINTFTIIESIQQDIQKKIDMEQKRLSDIRVALNSAQQFLLDNGYEELRNTDDILEEVMKTIKNMKQQTVVDNEDIENIQQSIRSLKSIKSNIDANIILSLEQKIKEIEATIGDTKDKLASITDDLTILLNLQIVCPVCNGNCNVPSADTTDEKRFAKAGSTSCTYCEGVGYLNIEKVLINEGIIDVKMANHQNNFQKTPTSAIDKLQNLQKQNGHSTHNKYIINRK